MRKIRCIKVVDGDSLRVALNHKEERLRLLYIDAPEYGQRNQKGRPVWRLSYEFLKEHCHQEAELNALIFGKDRYGRLLAEVFSKERSLNLELVQTGQAFLYPGSRYPSRQVWLRYKYSQIHARKAFKGVWSNKMQKPWSYRKRMKRMGKSFHPKNIK